MGATKLLGEKLVMSASRSTKRPVFSVVRFGNVLGSRGSATVIFEMQVRDGRPMTITDPEMTRFIMNPRESARLVIRAAQLADPGEVFVLKMRAVRIGDLFEACREFFSRVHKKDSKSIRVKKLGAQPGEKMHEELMTLAEAENAAQLEDFFVVNPAERRRRSSVPSQGGRGGSYSSRNAPLLKKGEIMAELGRLYAQANPTHH